MMKRRRVIGLVASVCSLSGCVGSGGDSRGSQDSDNDGVIDQADIAPNDPDVQSKADLERGTTVPPTPTRIPEQRLESFEGTGDVSGWHGDADALKRVEDGAEGSYSGKLAFSDPATTIWLTFEKTVGKVYSFWWKTDAVDDESFSVTLQNDQDAVGFGMEVGTGDEPVVVVNPGENEDARTVLYDSPQADTWYRTVFLNLDFTDHVYDAQLQDSDGTVVGDVTGKSFKEDISRTSKIQIRNAMDSTQANAYIDSISRVPKSAYISN